jgi:hypothetical protein
MKKGRLKSLFALVTPMTNLRVLGVPAVGSATARLWSEAGRTRGIHRYVYRGSAIPKLQGRYFYSDLCRGFLKSFVHVNGTAGEQTDWGMQAPVNSFGEDRQKELYLLSGNSTEYRIARH